MRRVSRCLLVALFSLSWSCAAAPDATRDGGADEARPDIGSPIAVGALVCADAPIVDAPALLLPPDGSESLYVRVRVPPRSAVGFLSEPDRYTPTVCGSCAVIDAFQQRCFTDEVGPVRMYEELGQTYYLPYGRPLATNDGVADRVVVLALDPAHRARIQLVLFALETAPPETIPCVPSIVVSDGPAVLGTASCGVSVSVPPLSAALVFGVFGSSPFANGDVAPMSYLASGQVAAAAITIPFEGAHCSDPIPLSPGTHEIRADLSAGSSSELCPVSTHLGDRYLEVAIPPHTRAVLEASSAMIADGGGNAVLATAVACGAAMCGTVAEQPWMSAAPPARLEIDNEGTTEMRHLVSLHQHGVGYYGNVITLSLTLTPL